jgi:hypothetical protein
MEGKLAEARGENLRLLEEAERMSIELAVLQTQVTEVGPDTFFVFFFLLGGGERMYMHKALGWSCKQGSQVERNGIG